MNNRTSRRSIKFVIGDAAILALLLLISVATIGRVYLEMGGLLQQFDQRMAANAAAHPNGTTTNGVFSVITSALAPR